MNWEERTTEALRQAGHRTGAARRAVVSVLARANCCYTAPEIADELRAEGRAVGIASVYRVLDLLTDKGLLQRVELGEGTARYEPVHSSGEHHHHLVCDDCGKVEAFADDELELALRRVEQRTGYSVAGHDVILRGTCRDCS
jgi:Fur family ferric uptake transcriptional regulator